MPRGGSFEIHSAFDHLKRFHLDNESEEKCAEKAFSHLKRGLLDAFKLKLKYHNAEYEKLINPKTDLRLIDSGKYFPELLIKRNALITTAREARIYEGKQNVEEAFEKWYEVSGLIDQIEKNFFDPAKIQWAKRQGFLHFSGTFVIGIVTGFITSTIVSILVYFFTK